MKKVLITGASDGLGLALAKLLVADGVEVVNISRRKPPIDIEHIQCDLTDEQQINKGIETIKSDHNNFDALIHCAGAMYFHKPNKISFEDMQDGFATNVTGITVLTSGLYDLLLKNNADLIVTSSTVGFKTYKDQSIYGATKRADRSIAKYFQDELKNTPCRVISFCPGGMQTKIAEKVTGEPVDNNNYMPVEGVAMCMKQILELPKYMEVSEIVINRKIASI